MKNEECIFCKIIRGDIKSKLLYKDDEMIVINDINPKAPVHLLIIPIKHLESLQDMERTDVELLGRILYQTKLEAKRVGIGKDGYKLVLNNGVAAGQVVFHLHIHLLGGWKKRDDWVV